MSIEQIDVVDFVTVDRQSGKILLTISDHLTWPERVDEHLLLLQEKLNAYLRFVESGEIFQTFPELAGRCVIFNLVMKYEPPEYARIFLAKAAKFTEEAGYPLEWKVMRSKDDERLA